MTDLEMFKSIVVNLFDSVILLEEVNNFSYTINLEGKKVYTAPHPEPVTVWSGMCLIEGIINNGEMKTTIKLPVICPHPMNLPFREFLKVWNDTQDKCYDRMLEIERKSIEAQTKIAQAAKQKQEKAQEEAEKKKKKTMAKKQKETKDE